MSAFSQLSPALYDPAATKWESTVGGRPNMAEDVSREMQGDASADRQPVKKLSDRHRDYAATLECWLDLAYLFEGGNMAKRRADKLLKKRPREDQDVFTARMERFTYQNILGTALGWYGAAMFQNEPEFFFNGTQSGPMPPDKRRSTQSGTDDLASAPPFNKTKSEGKTFYDNFLANCDGNGTLYVNFWKKAFTSMLLFGRAWVLTDLNTVDSGETAPITMKEQIDRGLLDPHVMLFSPMNVINWQEDRQGALEWVVVEVTEEEKKFLGPKEVVTRWYYFDRQIFKVYELREDQAEVTLPTNAPGKYAELVKQGNHALAPMNRVPIRRVELDEGLWLANRSYLLLVDHLNQDNSLAWALFMSNLAMPVIIGDFDGTNMTNSEAGYLQFPQGTTYQWSEPEGKSFTQSAQRLESLREEAFRCMHLQAQGRSMKATPAMQSGRSKIMEMVPAHEVLSAMGGSVRTSMQDVLCDVRDARQDFKTDPDVRGLTFDDDMTTEEVFAVSSVLAIGVPSDKFERYLMYKVAKSWMRNANPDEIQAVYDEIMSAPTLSERANQDLQKRIQLVKTGMGKALQQVNSPGLIRTVNSGGAPPSTDTTPGKGGSGAPNPVDVQAGYTGE